jgi:hypothetical protein
MDRLAIPGRWFSGKVLSSVVKMRVTSGSGYAGIESCRRFGGVV